MSTRKQRGLSERIFLLNATLQDDNWKLSIKGSSKRIYKITLSNNIIKCGCMDFSIRHKVCKHLYFILGRIINSDNLTKNVKEVDDMIDNYELLSKLLKLKLSNHVCQDEEDIIYDKKDTCCICFEEFGKENVIQCESQCKNTFHKDCINLWLSNNSSCPLCRSTWLKKCSSNPLEEFSKLNIS